MRAQRLFITCILLVLLAGCAPKLISVPEPPEERYKDVADVRTMPQDPTYYAEQGPQALLLSADAQDAQYATYLDNFFAPWNRDKSPLTAENALWGITVYSKKQGFGENKLARSKEWMQGLIEQANAPAFPSMARKAISVRNSAYRVMPTHRPFFYDFKKAGEGFPFDYFQNSALWAGTPLMVTHVSLDGAWVFVEGGRVSGWVRAQDVAYVDDAFITAYQNGDYVALVRDGAVAKHPAHAPIVGGQFILTAHVGTLFPRVPGKKKRHESSGSTVYVPVADENGLAVLTKAQFALGEAQQMPMPMTAASVASVASVLAGQQYGWGGMYEDRDCSAMLKDLYTPFGIWLPRNSSAQAKAGRVVDVEQRSAKEKEQMLLKQGVPFATLVGMRGHIMLYVGAYKGRAMVFHNVWGLRTLDALERTGRFVIGRAVITTLEPGEEYEEVARAKKSLLSRVRSLTFVGEQ